MSSLQIQDTRSDVPCKLLSLAEVMLATKSLREALREAADFFQWPVTVLMDYSTEGIIAIQASWQLGYSLYGVNIHCRESWCYVYVGGMRITESEILEFLKEACMYP